jgi:5'-methylthioadenosine phosphorylase
MGYGAVISGTVPVEDEVISKGTEVKLDTPHGPTSIMKSGKVLYLFRHGSSAHDHILPHRVNHPANLWALKEMGAEQVIGICSVGSLKRLLSPGTLLIPDDFIMLSGAHPVFPGEAVHITPTIDAGVRTRLLHASRMLREPVIDGGVYWQTIGPRLETKAEIRMMALFGEVVGMTMAGEAIAALELNLPYAAICSVDNYAHGLGEQRLTLEEITGSARENARRVWKVVKKTLQLNTRSA